MEPETPAPKRNRKSKTELAMNAAIERRGLSFTKSQNKKADASLAKRMKCWRIEQSYDRQD